MNTITGLNGNFYAFGAPSGPFTIVFRGGLAATDVTQIGWAGLTSLIPPTASGTVGVATVLADGGNWQLLATNNETFSTATTQEELPRYLSHSATAALAPDATSVSMVRQQVQELFDTDSWRQARVDLSAYVGRAGLRLRFDFTTAGKMNDPSVDVTKSGNFFNNTRAQNNKFRGFFIDDIIVGFAERGEMVTGGFTAVTTVYDLPDNPTTPLPPTPPAQLTGQYQVEIRRGPDYGDIVNRQDPNDVLTQDLQVNFNNRNVPADRTLRHQRPLDRDGSERDRSECRGKWNNVAEGSRGRP